MSDISSVPIQEEYDYSVIPYGNNISGITFNIVKVDTNTIKIDRNIPVSAPDPIQTNCPGYYNNYNLNLPIWDVMPMVIVSEPVFNCEITRLFINRNKKLI